jgi:vitellogenic carboxypeptidase-like protein
MHCLDLVLNSVVAGIHPCVHIGCCCTPTGKYVPSIAHYILQSKADGQTSVNKQQQQDALAASAPQLDLKYRRALPSLLEPPVFHLAGIAIGNGLTDPRAQTATLAPTAWYQGLVSSALRDTLEARASQVGQAGL